MTEVEFDALDLVESAFTWSASERLAAQADLVIEVAPGLQPATD